MLCDIPAGEADCTQVLMEFLTPLTLDQLQVNVITQSQHSTWWYCFDRTGLGHLLLSTMLEPHSLSPLEEYRQLATTGVGGSETCITFIISMYLIVISCLFHVDRTTLPSRQCS